MGAHEDMYVGAWVYVWGSVGICIGAREYMYGGV